MSARYDPLVALQYHEADLLAEAARLGPAVVACALCAEAVPDDGQHRHAILMDGATRETLRPLCASCAGLSRCHLCGDRSEQHIAAMPGIPCASCVAEGVA